MRRITALAVTAAVSTLAACSSDHASDSPALGMNDMRRGSQETVGATGVTQTIRLDGLGAADLVTAQGGPAQGQRDEKLQPYAIFEGPLRRGFA